MFNVASNIAGKSGLDLFVHRLIERLVLLATLNNWGPGGPQKGRGLFFRRIIHGQNIVSCWSQLAFGAAILLTRCSYSLQARSNDDHTSSPDKKLGGFYFAEPGTKSVWHIVRGCLKIPKYWAPLCVVFASHLRRF